MSALDAEQIQSEKRQKEELKKQQVWDTRNFTELLCFKYVKYLKLNASEAGQIFCPKLNYLEAKYFFLQIYFITLETFLHVT